MRGGYVVLLLLALAAPCWSAESCRQLRFDVSVKAEQQVFKDIGSGLRFRMEPQGEDSGWHFEIGSQAGDESEVGYVYLVTAPWRSRHVTALDTRYGVLAQEATDAQPRGFWFLLRPGDAKEAGELIDRILWPSTDDPPDVALKKLGQLARGTGELRVLRAKIRPGRPDARSLQARGDYGAIYSMTVRVSLTVPLTFKPAAGIRAGIVPCPGPGDWP